LIDQLVVRSLVVLALMAVGCSSSDDKSDDDDGSSSGANGQAGTSAGTAGTAAGAGAAGMTATAGASGAAGTGTAGSAGMAAMPIECGSTTCEPTGSFFMRACCADSATSTCGMSFSFGGGGGCSVPVDPDPRCDSITIMTFQLPSCCTADNRCGIDSSGFDMGGCRSLDELAEIAMGDGGVGDGGMPMTMGGFDISVVLPEPRDCE